MKILKSVLVSPRKAALVFSRDLDALPSHVKSDSSDGVRARSCSVMYAPITTVGAAVGYYIENDYAHFVLTLDGYPNISAHSTEDYYLCGSFNGWKDAIGNPKWRMKKGGTEEFPYWSARVPMSEFPDRRKKQLFKFATPSRWLEPLRTSPNIEYDSSGNANLRFSPEKTGRNIIFASFENDFDFSSAYKISAPEICPDVSDLDMGWLLVRLSSDEKLGAFVEGGHTYFRLFSPRANRAFVTFRKYALSAPQTFEMRKSSLTTWTAEFPENLHGALYHYNVFGKNADAFTAFDGTVNIYDPFAKAVESPNSDAFVVDQRRLPKPEKRFNPPSWHDLVIMEAHIRDVLAAAPDGLCDEHEKLRFSGLSKWLKSPDCYLRKAGVNCVELQPIQEFSYSNASEYQWGYMPVNWFAPSSAYADSPQTLSQPEDFAKLVKAFHDAGIAVVLDVVYNHVGEPNSLIRLGKRYFFETDSAGNLVNFSGCGNDFRADTPVGIKLVCESLEHLIETYDVDGFRFDLAELLGVGTLREIERRVKRAKPSAILIAEPWSFRGHIARALKDTGFSSWNDGFREFAKEFVFDAKNFDAFRYFMTGSYGGAASWPSQTVNYIESHDDKCFLDRITSSYNNPSCDDIRRYKMAYAFTLLAIGIPMVAEGFDLLRTKDGRNNTYLDGAANALDYSRAMRFTGVGEWLRNFASFRKSRHARALKLCDTPQSSYFKFFKDADSSACAVLFNADKSLCEAPRIFAAFNTSVAARVLPLKDFRLSENFVQIADIDRFNIKGLSDFPIDVRADSIKLPPLSVAVWIERDR